MHRRRSLWLLWLALPAALLVVAAVTVARSHGGAQPPRTNFPLALDPGTPLSGAAPDFTLTDQFGRHVSLHEFRGRVVILAFNDSQCTTVCPLTTTAMADAKRFLGTAGSRVALLGIDANPKATSIADVRAYSEVHGLTRTWQFLTGSLSRLVGVWRAYHIAVEIQHGQIDHTPALFVIGPTGAFAKVYLTQMSYTGVQQQGRLLAQEASSLLPGHPAVETRVSFTPIPTITPGQFAQLPGAGGGTVALRPSGPPRLYLFFATWDSQVTDLAAQLARLRRYRALAAAHGLPALTAVDEASVEPSASALPRFLATLARPLDYPVAIDTSGRVADGYGVQDEPWFVLVSGGRLAWYWDVSTVGWPSTRELVSQVRSALSRPAGPANQAAVRAALSGSPPLLAALHAQAGRLLGGLPALQARLRALRGYPVVLNVWASWCTPCRSEFGLLASASARYGREVAFLGADTGDQSGDAQAFLAGHPVSYPSYRIANVGALSPVAVVGNLPTTIFIDRAGRIAYVHIGEYVSQGTLDADIAAYASATK